EDRNHVLVSPRTDLLPSYARHSWLTLSVASLGRSTLSSLAERAQDRLRHLLGGDRRPASGDVRRPQTALERAADRTLDLRGGVVAPGRVAEEHGHAQDGADRVRDPLPR